jgi:hypothetical protein
MYYPKGMESFSVNQSKTSVDILSTPNLGDLYFSLYTPQQILARKQWQTGYTNYLALLNAEQAYQDALINLVQAHANRYIDTAALFYALGGGWWNREDIPKN